jgi:lactoylglutathione lyase
MRALASMIAAMLVVSPSRSLAAEDVAPFVAAMDHVAISVADADKSAAFYSDVFGFKQVPAPVPMARWLVMANGVMLHVVGNRKASSDHSRWDHLALACADMDAVISKLNARHVPWTDMDGRDVPQVRSDGVKQIFVQDPDGYWIEINDAAKYR